MNINIDTNLSLKDATDAEIPIEIAGKVLLISYEYIEKNIWIPIAIESMKYSNSSNSDFEQSTSIIVYWGKREILEKYDTNGGKNEYYNETYGSYELLSPSKAKDLFRKKGIIYCKSHELRRGSSKYPTWFCPNCKNSLNNFPNNSTNVSKCLNCGKEIPENLDNKFLKRNPNMPSKGSRILAHRHLELGDMCKYLERHQKLNEFLSRRIN